MSSSFVTGQTWDRTKGYGLMASFIRFTGDPDERAALGNWGGFSVKYGASSNIMFDLSVGYGSYKPQKGDTWYEKDESSPYRTFLFPLELAVKATPLPRSRIKPFVTLGAGFLFWDLRDVSDSDISFWDDKHFRWGESVHDGMIKNFSIMEGVGVEIFFTEFLSLDLQARFSSLLKVKDDNLGLNDFNDQVIETRAALTFYFDYYKDSDEDGIEDKFDTDPHHPEDFDEYQDGDGAPDYDNDLDGVPDLKDKAPLEAEDRDGFQDEDGVPDPDNDNDGIKDVNDGCPDEVEDFDGYKDEDGCPDTDNDGDGIPDLEDKCPNDPETKNGYQDDDGCPDKKPMPKLEKKGAKLILKGVNFASGSAALTYESYTILNKVIESLKDHKEVEIEIRGYTDSVGGAATNQRLSESRANTVRLYLINHGIEAYRLRSVGYGERDPIASNTTVTGRAENRRIEFVRTK
jgi:outer membrane protein OmpA-like peptidoglycan-associated protein